MFDLPMVVTQALANRQDLLIALIDRAGRLLWANQTFAFYSKRSIEELLGQKFFHILSLNSQNLPQQTYIREQLIKGESFKFEFVYYRDDDSTQLWLLMDGQPIYNSEGIIDQYSLLATDITLRKQAELDLKEAKNLLEQINQELEVRVQQRTSALVQEKEKAEQTLNQLQQMQVQLIQTEKMSALGNLVAGVAHEINNPVGFLVGNLQPAKDYVQDLFGLIDLYQEKYPNFDPDIYDEIETIDLEYLREDLPKLIISMESGVNRLKAISASLRIFSRDDSDRPISFNIHEGLESTLLILKHRLKGNETRPEIQVVKDYGDLPLVKCYAGQLNQVFMNLLANAIDALEESNQICSFEYIKDNPNQIGVRTKLSEDRQQVLIHISDNGPGMMPDVKECIFEQSFTTKAVGKGTGLGLAIARQIVVEKHGGNLYCCSQPGEGAEFIIELPV
ncbi:PAS domain-containing protein [Nostoc sp. KVJ3]|uniref:sensor histidine kinase n=1 Tax=Nostoc sp. KVJ3 TaxID=457945 RepID=UPI002238F551|nr:ATP-binding protein [Nostoc sp. KVJ3]MCW5319580.1 PAS domain-containing protein [Nostoc sp. KVJ3]